MSERSVAVRYVTTRCGRFSGVGKERAGGGGEKTGENDVDDGLTYRTATDARFPSLKRYQTWPDTFRPFAADSRRPDASDRRETGEVGRERRCSQFMDRTAVDAWFAS